MQELAAVLPKSFHQSIFKFLKDEDKYKALVGKLMLLRQLTDRGFNADLIASLDADYYGKPTIPNVPAFNISHTHGFVICAMGDHEKQVLGADVEYVKKMEMKWFESCFNKSEWEMINAAPDPMCEFYRYWTMKESFIKADGRGLSLEPVRVITKGMSAQEEGKDTVWHFHPLDLHQDYQVHLCLEKEEAHIVCEEFVLEEEKTA